MQGGFLTCFLVEFVQETCNSPCRCLAVSPSTLRHVFCILNHSLTFNRIENPSSSQEADLVTLSSPRPCNVAQQIRALMLQLVIWLGSLRDIQVFMKDTTFAGSRSWEIGCTLEFGA